MDIFENITWWTLLDAYLIWIISVIIIKFVVYNKRLLQMTFFVLIIGIIYGLARILDLPMSQEAFFYIFTFGTILIMILAAPTIRLAIESFFNDSKRINQTQLGNDHTKAEIIKAVAVLSKQSIGAIITIEKHNKLDQYSQKAVILNSDISHELLINVFTPNTPLHDGAVIIRGDKILCASAYFVLSSNEQGDKTTGSRHRAALGISEITDSLTIVVSEETGMISLAINGVMTKIKDIETLNEYFNLFMR